MPDPLNKNYINLLIHEVTDNPNDSGLVRKSALPYKHSIAQFRNYLNLLEKYKESITNPSTQKWLHNYKSISITFDDGGISNRKSAQMLDEIGVKGIFFIVTDRIGTPGFMGEDDIRQLHQSGHIIGSHSHTHPNVFKSLTEAEMLFQWSKSKEILENILGEKVSICSIPGGDASILAYQTALASGYSILFDSEPIDVLRNYHELAIYGRLCLKTSHSNNDLESWLNGDGIKKYQRIWNTKKFLKRAGYPLYKLKRSLDQ